MQILVIEDDPDIRELVFHSMTQARYHCHACGDAKSARKLIAEIRPDCLIVDWMLPDSSGIEIIRWLRRQKPLAHIPVLMLTARTQESDMITGLESGADDYMTKPMSLRELQARVKALLRRPPAYTEPDVVLQAGPIKLDITSHEVRVGQQLLELTRTEYKLLRFFVENQRKVFTREQLLNAIWGDNAYLSDRTVDVHILRLRKILRKHALDNMVKTVRGAGYRFSSAEGPY